MIVISALSTTFINDRQNEDLIFEVLYVFEIAWVWLHRFRER